MAHLEDWALHARGFCTIAAPEDDPIYLSGTVTGSAVWDDGAKLRTSRIIAIHWADDGQMGVVTKSGSVYLLGKPYGYYEETYPLAKMRLCKALRQRPSRVEP